MLAILMAASNTTASAQEGGPVVAWGRNDFRQCSVPAWLSNVTGAAGGHARVAVVARSRAVGRGAFMAVGEGELAWSLLLLMARSEEVVEQAIAA